MTMITNSNYKIITLGRKLITESSKHLTYNIANDKITLPELTFSKVVHIAGKAHVFPKTEKA